MNENELQPWVVVVGDEADHSLAMWRLSETQQPALALFSSADQAERYAAENATSPWLVKQPSRPALLSIMIECYQKQIQLAVLDPDQATARRIFNLRDVLRAAREELSGLIP